MSEQLPLNFRRYPRQAGHQGTDTSKAAAAKLNKGGKAALMREAVMQQYAGGEELTPDECAERMGLSVLSVRPRCTELKALELLVDTGKRRKNESGSSAAVLKQA